LIDLIAHMDNSICHNGRQITKKMQSERIRWAPYLADSPDLSPCDFWLFGFLKEKLKEQELSTPEQMIEAITVLWEVITFDELQSVFLKWIQRLIWFIANSGEYFNT
jgi:hypothetical protein